MAEMMFYERVVALSDQIHAQLKVRPASSFSYAARTNSVPVLGGEMFECAREYPIVFARGQVGPLPAVLLGLRGKTKICSSTPPEVGCALRSGLRAALSLCSRHRRPGRVAGLHRRGISLL
jgi:hypothetical protein